MRGSAGDKSSKNNQDGSRSNHHGGGSSSKHYKNDNNDMDYDLNDRSNTNYNDMNVRGGAGGKSEVSSP